MYIYKERNENPTRGGRTRIVTWMLSIEFGTFSLHLSIVIRDETWGRVGAIALGPWRRRARGGFRGRVAFADASRV
jgi:hypothetical protein